MDLIYTTCSHVTYNWFCVLVFIELVFIFILRPFFSKEAINFLALDDFHYYTGFKKWKIVIAICKIDFSILNFFKENRKIIHKKLCVYMSHFNKKTSHLRNSIVEKQSKMLKTLPWWHHLRKTAECVEFRPHKCRPMFCWVRPQWMMHKMVPAMDWRKSCA